MSLIAERTSLIVTALSCSFRLFAIDSSQLASSISISTICLYQPLCQNALSRPGVVIYALKHLFNLCVCVHGGLFWREDERAVQHCPANNCA
eukprot:4435655-Amphidinium_carterae.1